MFQRGVVYVQTANKLVWGDRNHIRSISYDQVKETSILFQSTIQLTYRI